MTLAFFGTKPPRRRHKSNQPPKTLDTHEETTREHDSGTRKETAEGPFQGLTMVGYRLSAFFAPQNHGFAPFVCRQQPLLRQKTSPFSLLKKKGAFPTAVPHRIFLEGASTRTSQYCVEARLSPQRARVGSGCNPADVPFRLSGETGGLQSTRKTG